MPGFWDQPEVRAIATNPEFASFKIIGDENEGTVASLGVKKSFEGTVNESVGYEIKFTDAPTVTANTRMLIQGLLELQPEVGDRLYIKFLEEQRVGAGAMKRYLLRLTKPNGQILEINQGHASDGIVKILADPRAAVPAGSPLASVPETQALTTTDAPPF